MLPSKCVVSPRTTSGIQGNEEAKTAYIEPKHMANRTICLAKFEAEKEEFATVSTNGDGVFHIARQMDRTNQDIVGENCVCNDAGELALTNEDKMKAWVEHYAKLLNVEFEWPSNELPEIPVCNLQPWSAKHSARLLGHLES